MNNIAERYRNVRDQVSLLAKEAGRSPETVKLLPVSKTFTAEQIRQVYESGARAFGESYIQEALQKIAALQDLDISWHFIGPLQSNKTRDVARNFDWLHSLDRLKIARRLNEQRPEHFEPLNVCIQVNISADPAKSGIDINDVAGFADQLQSLAAIRLRGLMAVPAVGLNTEELKRQYAFLAQKFYQLQQRYSSCDTLSLGMSSDMAEAIACGSTLVRVGSGIFGERHYMNEQESLNG